MRSRKLMGALAGLFFAVACLWTPANRAEDFSDTTGSVKWKVFEYHRGRLRAMRCTVEQRGAAGSDAFVQNRRILVQYFFQPRDVARLNRLSGRLLCLRGC